VDAPPFEVPMYSRSRFFVVSASPAGASLAWIVTRHGTGQTSNLGSSRVGYAPLLGRVCLANFSHVQARLQWLWLSVLLILPLR